MKNAEVTFTLIALQTADAFWVATPADWRPGDELIVPPAGLCGIAKDRMDGKGDMTFYDWFFWTKQLDKDTVMKAIRKK